MIEGGSQCLRRILDRSFFLRPEHLPHRSLGQLDLQAGFAERKCDSQGRLPKTNCLKAQLQWLQYKTNETAPMAGRFPLTPFAIEATAVRARPMSEARRGLCPVLH